MICVSDCIIVITGHCVFIGLLPASILFANRCHCFMYRKLNELSMYHD